MRYKERKWRLEGSYTVEMALLFPLILGVLVFSLGWTFYFYDLCLLDIHANLAALEGGRYSGMSERSREKKVREQAEEVTDRLIAVKNFTVSVQTKGDKISVAYSGSYTFPIFHLLVDGNQKKEAVQVQAESVMQNAVEWVRTVRKAGRIAEYIKGSAE